MDKQESHNQSLLEGVRILELGNVVAAPFAASLLADFGAEVIKVEQPDQGDSIRASGIKKSNISLWFKVSVSKWMKEHEREEIIRLFTEAGAVAGPIYDIKKIFEDVHYLERKDIVTVDDPELGRIRMVGVMPKFPAMPGKIRWTGKSMGAFNQEVYGDLLGMTPAELQTLKAEGII